MGQLLRFSALFGALWASCAWAGLLDPIESDEPAVAEQDVTDLPAPPEEVFLQPFALEGEARHRYYIDRRSLVIGGDGIVRFSLVIRPQTGRLQSSYAGVHCRAGEWKTYAVITTEGQWRRLSAPAWESIEIKRRDSARGDLYRHYLCLDGMPSGTPEQMLRTLGRSIPQAHRSAPLPK